MTEAPPSARKPRTVRKAAANAVSATGTTARNLAGRTAAGIEANPLAVLAGGAALGALAGSLVPRTEREQKLLGSVGKRLNETARGAIDAAKDTARSEFDVLGLSRDSARDQVGKLLGGVVKALATAGTAALATRTINGGDASASAARAPAKDAPKKSELEV